MKSSNSLQVRFIHKGLEWEKNYIKDPKEDAFTLTRMDT